MVSNVLEETEGEEGVRRGRGQEWVTEKKQINSNLRTLLFPYKLLYNLYTNYISMILWCPEFQRFVKLCLKVQNRENL